MLNAKELARLITGTVQEADGQILNADTVEAIAVKIAGILEEDNKVAVSAAALENEVTSTLMDMTVATVLATLIEEEGGGRANIVYSPMSMDHMMQNYTYTVENEGLVRTVRIAMREDSDLQSRAAWREPSHRHGLVDVADTNLLPPEDAKAPPVIGELKPQAEPKVHNRPVWAIRVDNAVDQGSSLLRMHDQGDATRQLRAMAGDHPTAQIENRWCLHPECPTTGCNEDTKLQDSASEVASDA